MIEIQIFRAPDYPKTAHTFGSAALGRLNGSTGLNYRGSAKGVMWSFKQTPSSRGNRVDFTSPARLP
jgi:hypothetical protein